VSDKDPQWLPGASRRVGRSMAQYLGCGGVGVVATFNSSQADVRPLPLR
jgi:hypothetical protein